MAPKTKETEELRLRQNPISILQINAEEKINREIGEEEETHTEERDCGRRRTESDRERRKSKSDVRPLNQKLTFFTQVSLHLILFWII